MEAIKCPTCRGAGQITPDTLGGMAHIKRINEKLGLRAVAKATGVSPATISRFERGGKITNAHFKVLAEWCGLTPDQAWPLLDEAVGV